MRNCTFTPSRNAPDRWLAVAWGKTLYPSGYRLSIWIGRLFVGIAIRRCDLNTPIIAVLTVGSEIRAVRAVGNLRLVDEK